MVGRARNISFGAIIAFAVLYAAILFGSLIIGLIFYRSPLSAEYYDFSRILFFISASAFALLAAVEFGAKFFDRDASWNTLFIALAILAFVLSSEEARYVYGLKEGAGYVILDIVHYVAFIIALYFFFAFYWRDYKVQAFRWEWLILHIFFVSLLIGGAVLRYFHHSFFILPIIFLFCFYAFLRALIQCYIRGKINYTFFASGVIFFALMGTMGADGLAEGKVLVTDIGFASFNAFLMSLAFYSIYLIFAVKTSQKAYKTERYESQVRELQSDSLRRQMDPHFLFNSLNIVKANYASNQAKGERSIDLLSRLMRTMTSAGDKPTVAFEEELQYIAHFVELANMGLEKPFEVIYNIDVEDFAVPTLGVQTFVENAIRYSQANERGGYIEIRTVEEGEETILQIIDTGVGFDQKEIDRGHYGIHNSAERFKLLLGAKTEIVSSSSGTEVTIRIPRKKEVHQ